MFGGVLLFEIQIVPDSQAGPKVSVFGFSLHNVLGFLELRRHLLPDSVGGVVCSLLGRPDNYDFLILY